MPTNVIVGCNSTQLTENERALFKDLQPWGIILFARNINNPAQITALIEECKQLMCRDDLMVFIDQEGGRVSRLPKTHWRIPPSPTVFANMYDDNIQMAKRACLLNAMLTGLELKVLGINANCAPMLDIPQRYANAIIHERALGNTPQKVIDLATQISTGLQHTGVAPVIKHMPGHGRATNDSHLELPQIDSPLSELNDWDFAPFRAMCEAPMAMTAHIVFTQIDRNLPATISPTVVNDVMRDAIGFKGLIMTDDLNMNALSGTVASRAQQALAAGCDIALHCSGQFEEMRSLANVAQELSGTSLQRAKIAEKAAFKTNTELSADAITQELALLMASYS